MKRKFLAYGGDRPPGLSIRIESLSQPPFSVVSFNITFSSDIIR